jgi:hypothetical protein
VVVTVVVVVSPMDGHEREGAANEYGRDLLSWSLLPEREGAPRAGKEEMTIDRKWAEAFAREWIDAWNAHDLERIFPTLCE